MRGPVTVANLVPRLRKLRSIVNRDATRSWGTLKAHRRVHHCTSSDAVACPVAVPLRNAALDVADISDGLGDVVGFFRFWAFVTGVR